MRLVRDLAAYDRRLPFGSATMLGASVLGVLVSGTVVAATRDSTSATVTQTGSPAAPGGSPKPAPTKTEKPDEPADYLLDVEAAVPGWTRIKDRAVGAGPMDLEAAAKIEAGGDKVTDEDREALRELGYVRGHSRAWRNFETTVIVFVYEWKSSKGPLTFVRGIKAINEGDAGWQPKTPASYGMCTAEGGQISDGAVTAVGKHSFLVITLRKGGCGTHEPAAQLTDLIHKHAKSLGA